MNACTHAHTDMHMDQQTHHSNAIVNMSWEDDNEVSVCIAFVETWLKREEESVVKARLQVVWL